MFFGLHEWYVLWILKIELQFIFSVVSVRKAIFLKYGQQVLGRVITVETCDHLQAPASMNVLPFLSPGA